MARPAPLDICSLHWETLPPYDIQMHPCPRQLHHPGERCRCGEALSKSSPPKLARAFARGDVHAARAHNLSWRLSSRRTPLGASVPSHEIPLSPQIPPSLRVLYEDHSGDADAKALRPLSPKRSATPSCSRFPAKTLQAAGFKDQQNRSRRRLAAGGVSFRGDDGLVVEVPVLNAPIDGKPVPPRYSERRYYPGELEMERAKRENLARLIANHRSLFDPRSQQELACWAFFTKAAESLLLAGKSAVWWPAAAAAA